MKDWQIILSNIRSDIGESTFKTWFTPIRFLSSSENHVDLEVPNRFYFTWFTDHYLDLIAKNYSRVTGKKFFIRLHIASSPDSSNSSTSNDNNNTSYHYYPEQVSRYTFNNFLVSKSNMLVYKTARQIASDKPTFFNLCYIYGVTGIGKTHLLLATKDHIEHNCENLTVEYLSAYQFMDKIADSSKNGNILNVRDELRNTDVLLFDDVHKLSGYYSFQEELLFLINTLINSHKKIFVTADRSPKSISQISVSIRSRLSGGLLLPMYPSDKDAKKQILLAICTSEGIHLPDKVIDLISRMDEYNIHRLTQYIVRLGALSSVEKASLNLETIDDIYKFCSLDTKTQISKIQKAVCEYFSVSMEDLFSQKKSRRITLARQIAMYLCRTSTSLSFSKIGSYFKGKDHSTVLKSYNRVRKRLEEDQTLKIIINEINTVLNN